MRRLLILAAISASLALAASCREPTQITISITTDAKCTDIDGVGISVGVLGADLDNKPASAISLRCDAATGRVGSLVLVPSGSNSDEIAFRVTAGYGKKVDDCRPPFGAGCIVARRAVRYIPHTPLYVPVKLSVACNGIACDPTSTCENGRCIDARIDPTKCESVDGCALTPDGGAADGGSNEAGPDAPAHEAGTPTASPVATVGDVPAETGTAQQQHLIFATHSSRWWMFTVDDAAQTQLKTWWSTDFATWTPGATFSMAEATRNEARNFSVTYADVGGKDVVHLAYAHKVSGDAFTKHVRATIDTATITFGSDEFVVSSNYFPNGADPSAPVVALSNDGNVFLATGWANQKPYKMFDTTGNMDVYQSTSPDRGAGSGPLSGYVVHSWVPEFDNSRALVAIESGNMLAFWPQALGQVDTTDISWASSKESWVTHDTLFGVNSATGQDDWSVCGFSPTEVHAVLRKINGGANDGYEHRRFDTATGAWTSGAIIPNDPGAYGTGVVLLTNGKTMLLFALSADAANKVRYTRYDGAMWSAWSTLFGPTTKRAFLSGSGCSAKSPAAIAWTEGLAAPYRAMAAEVTALF